MAKEDTSVLFHSVKLGTIFHDDFVSLQTNNLWQFSGKKVLVLYGPNGTGKSSLLRLLDVEEQLNDAQISYEYNGKTYTDGSAFFTVKDQIGRHIIKGKANDFLLGDNIRQEIELRDSISSELDAVSNQLRSFLKENGISKKGDPPLVFQGFDDNLIKLLSDFANSRYKPKRKEIKNFYALLTKKYSVDVVDEQKLESFRNSGGISLYKKVIDIKDFSQNQNVSQIEENDYAIQILQRYTNRTQCVVCDTKGINSGELLKSKQKHKKDIINSLAPETKAIIEQLLPSIKDDEPFNLKQILTEAITSGDKTHLMTVQTEMKTIQNQFCLRLLNGVAEILNQSDLGKKNDEYEKLIGSKFKLEDEDMLFIENFINSCISRNLQIERDEGENLVIKLGSGDVLEEDKLPLSSGEQNFLSLCFELLKARKAKQDLILIDDPISSFDSIYKNKMIFAIVRFLSDKKTIIMTHNFDVIRLLNAQFTSCFNLYLFNNIEKGDNGFIPVNTIETALLVDLPKLMNLFRDNKVKPNSLELQKQFLISLVPFMRGYASLIGKKDIKDKLSEVMHGYSTATVEIGKIYNQLFSIRVNKFETVPINVDEILRSSLPEKIIDGKNYPLLNKTLCTSFAFLYLRLRVEKTLVSKRQVSPQTKKGEWKMLGTIIDDAFPFSNDNEERKNRVFLTSKKTLLNEFNHFEGNMSIFQPALDISNTILQKEEKEIDYFCSNLKELSK